MPQTVRSFGPLVLACLSAGCRFVTQQPATNGPFLSHAPAKAIDNLRQHTQFAPIQSLAQKNSVQPPFEAFLFWQYAPGATNFCWTLQVSSNLVDWVDLPGACVTDPLTAYATNGSGFFRLKGAPFTP